MDEPQRRADVLKASPPMFQTAWLDRLSRVHPAVPVVIFVPAIGILASFAFARVPALTAVLLIAAGYPDANDCDALRSDPAFKMAVGRAPESGRALCSQPTMCRLENLPGAVALKRMIAAIVELFCDSFAEVPRRIVLDIDDTEDRVHGRQELALFHAHHAERSRSVAARRIRPRRARRTRCGRPPPRAWR